MRGKTWIAGIMGIALLALPVAAMAQQNGTYYKIEVDDYPPWDRPVDPYAQPYYRDADPNYRRNFEANVEAYKNRVTGSHHEHLYHSYTPEALADLEKLARKGDKMALMKLGDGYANGDGLPKNEHKAQEWYEMGARLGHNEFFSRMGDLYRESYKPPQSTFQRMLSYVSPDTKTVQQDDRIAFAWYEKGRVWKDPHSIIALSDFYERGLGGVQADKDIAREYAILGPQLLRRQNERADREFEMAANQYAERETPFNPQPQEPQTGGQTAMGGLQVQIGGRTCYYNQSQEQPAGYDFLYRAHCDGVPNRLSGKEQVSLPGLLCNVSEGAQGNQLQLKCNVIGGETITVAGIQCSLRNETPDKGFAATFGAYCQGDAQATREKVIYRGMECIPQRVYSEGGKHYTLYCNPQAAQTPVATQQQAADTLITIGNFSCVATERSASSAARRITYDVNCGGIAESAKSGPQVPRLIPYGEYLCDIAPVTGKEKVDFSMECRK